MTSIAGAALIALLLFGPVLSRTIEEHIEIFFLAIGLVAMTTVGVWNWEVLARAASVPIPITLAVIIADFVFGRIRTRIDRSLAWMQRRVSRPWLSGCVVLLIAALSSIVTAVVAALMLAEMIGSMRFGPRARVSVTVAGCFAIGLGSSLTPLGGPLSTLAASGLHMGFNGLFWMLAPYVLPGMVACSIVAGLFASWHMDPETVGAEPATVFIHEALARALVRGLEIFIFIAGLVLVGEAFSPLAARYVPLIGHSALFWANTVSAAMDNATLVALEIHGMQLARAREAIIALLVAGGMLVPGNIPNIVAASVLRIGSGAWARIGIPMGIVLLGIYFAFVTIAQ